MSKKKIIIFNGIHGAGKTSLAQELCQRFRSRFQFFSEVGGQIRQEVSYNVLESGDNFDKQVMSREFTRDKMVLKCVSVPIIETWHPGNLAFIHQRSPGMFEEYGKRFGRALLVFDPYCFLILISPVTFMSRITDKNVSAHQFIELKKYYDRILSFTYAVYKEFKLKYKEIRNDRDLSRTVVELVGVVGGLGV